jgi:hypothetical protein
MPKPKDKLKKSPGNAILIALVLVAVIALAVGSYSGKSDKGGDIIEASFCGDEFCDPWESPETCPQDCPLGALIPADSLQFHNCEYDGFDTLTCETNCIDTGVVILGIVDSDNKMAGSTGGDASDGTMVFHSGLVIFTPKPYFGDEESSNRYALSQLGPSNGWKLFFQCSEPEGQMLVFGVN